MTRNTSDLSRKLRLRYFDELKIAVICFNGQYFPGEVYEATVSLVAKYGQQLRTMQYLIYDYSRVTSVSFANTDYAFYQIKSNEMRKFLENEGLSNLPSELQLCEITPVRESAKKSWLEAEQRIARAIEQEGLLEKDSVIAGDWIALQGLLRRDLNELIRWTTTGDDNESL